MQICVLFMNDPFEVFRHYKLYGAFALCVPHFVCMREAHKHAKAWICTYGKLVALRHITVGQQRHQKKSLHGRKQYRI